MAPMTRNGIAKRRWYRELIADAYRAAGAAYTEMRNYPEKDNSDIQAARAKLNEAMKAIRAASSRLDDKKR